MVNTKIQLFVGSGFSNKLHARFHQAFYDHVREWEGTAPLKIPLEILQSYQKNIDAEIEINVAAREESAIKELAQLDKERDRLLSYFLSVASNAARSDVEANRKAAEALRIPLKGYRGIQKEGGEAESLLIDGLAVDMEKLENTTHVQTLKLEQTLVAIVQKNEQYKALQSKRIDKRSASTLESSKEVRPRTDADHISYCDYINAAYLTAAAGSGEKAEIEGLIGQLNTLVDRFRTLWKESGSDPKAEESAE